MTLTTSCKATLKLYYSEYLQHKLSALLLVLLFGDVFKLTELGIESAVLHRQQLQREARSELLQSRCFGVVNNVAMVTEEDKVTLIVESHDPAAVKIGLGREDGSKHATHRVAHARIKVVQNQFGVVSGCLAVVLRLDGSIPLVIHRYLWSGRHYST